MSKIGPTSDPIVSCGRRTSFDGESFHQPCFSALLCAVGQKVAMVANYTYEVRDTHSSNKYDLVKKVEADMDTVTTTPASP